MSNGDVIFSEETEREIFSIEGRKGFQFQSRGFEILQMAMYPTISKQVENGSVKARLCIYTDGRLSDIFEQRLPKSSVDPDVFLAMFLVEIQSDGYGYESISDYQNDLDGERCGEIAVSAKIKLKIEIIA